ncbi:ABC-type peptide transport system permease protein [Candidatus Phytoplasma asteris]|uniref:ABC-type peptide transport system permease protein n=1 Tax=Candidatus Phytoplasma asteris TaxID=85620 RepID=A0ABZ2YIC5_9MOLU
MNINKKISIFFSIKNQITKFLQNKNIIIGCSFLTILVLTILIISYLPYDYKPFNSQNQKPLQQISWNHLMGTDSTGYDLFSLILEGAKITLQISFFAVMISAFVGGFLGILSGYFRGMFDGIINFICDILVAFPDFILAILIMCFFKKGILALIIVLSISHIPTFIRSIRTNTMQIKAKSFIQASKALGATHMHIISKHILSHILAPFITRIILSMSSIILAISALGMVGLGLDPNVPEWGRILFESKSHFRFHPHLFFGPFVVILLTSLSFNLIGKGLIQLFNPKEKH